MNHTFYRLRLWHHGKSIKIFIVLNNLKKKIETVLMTSQRIDNNNNNNSNYAYKDWMQNGVICWIKNC